MEMGTLHGEADRHEERGRKERRRCIDCGYSDERPLGESIEPRRALGIRNVERTDNKKTPIRILDPGKRVDSD